MIVSGDGPDYSRPIDLTDDVVLIRSFRASDTQTLIEGRDEAFHRFLGPGSSSPDPVACIVVGRQVVGWIDFDHERDWMTADEVNVGYNVFAPHRANGYGRRALLLLCHHLDTLDPPLRPTLLIDPANRASIALAASAGFVHTADVDGELLFKRTPSAQLDSGV